MLELSLFLSMWLLLAALTFALYRVARGPTLLDRAVGLEVFTLVSIAIVLIDGIAANTTVFFDLMLLWALLAFIATSALGLHLFAREKR